MTHISRRAALCGIVSATTAAAAGAASAQGRMSQAEALLSAGYISADGRDYRIGTGGKPLTFVNLWANWCAACLSEMGSISGLAGSLGASNIDVMLVSQPQFWEADKQWARRHGIGLPLYSFAPGTSRSLIDDAIRANPVTRAYSVPWSIVFGGRQGGPLLSQEGSDEWNSPANVAKFKGFLAPDKQPTKGFSAGARTLGI